MMTQSTFMRLGTLVTLVALGACAVGPSPRPAAPVPAVPTRVADVTPAASRAVLDSLRTARDADRADTLSRTLWQPVALPVDATHDLAWLDILQDSQLVSLVRSAVENNRDLRLAQARVMEYRAELGVATSSFFPQISATGAWSANKGLVGSSQGVKYEAVRLLGTLGWELDFWGRIRRQRQAAQGDLLAREDDARATALTLVSDVATAYLQLRQADASLAIAEQTLSSRQATLNLAKRRFEQGVISELDVRQFEAQVAEPAARVAEFARQRARQENALSVLLGVAPGGIARGRALEAIVQSVTVPDSVPGNLIARRPDVMRAQHSWDAATARIGVVTASRLPTVSITGQYGTQRPNFDSLFTTQAETYTLQAGISIPLFTGGRIRSQERAARARADQAKAQYEQTVLQALREASDALAGVRLSRDQLVAQETQVKALQGAYSIAERRYAQGISSYLEVLDAQRGLFTAQLALIQVEQQYLGAVVQLYKALGSSWEPARPGQGRTSSAR